MKKNLIIISILLFLSSAIFAQTSTGRLLGTVSGPDGVLPNATVKAKDIKTGKELTVTSKEDGTFLFPQIEFGTYTVTFSVTGFKSFVANDVKIDVGRDYTLDPKLEIGNIQESVTVTAGAEVVTSTTAQVTNTVSPQQILSLPLITRDPLSLTGLQAGVAANTFQQTVINGMRTTSTNITRDGINIQDAFIRTNATDFAPGRPSVDDTGEFTITTTNQEADQGYGGAQIRLVTPRGSKNFSGALFAYNRNSHFAANNFFNNRSGLVRPFRNRNQFGGKIGGPLPIFNFGEGGSMFLKDKGFFFFSYEGIRDPLSGRYNRVILTPTARTGGFQFNRATAGSPNSICPSGEVGSVCSIPNILTFARSFGGTFLTVPGAIDPIIQQRIISQIPTGSNFTGGDGLNTAGYTLNRRQDTTRNTYTTRIDVDATERDSVNGVFSYNKEINLRPDADTNRYEAIPSVSQFSENKTLALAYRRIFSSNFVNEVRGGYFGSLVPFDRTDAIPSYFFAIPLISYPENNFLDQGRTIKSYNLQDNADLVLGNHSLRFGGQLQYFQVNTYNDAAIVPTFTIGTGAATPAFTALGNFANTGGAANTSLINTTQLGTANNLLALLGGIYNGGTQSFNVENKTSGFTSVGSLLPYRYENHSLYISDRWSVARGLTLTLGMRYELFPALKLANGLHLEPVIADADNPIPSLLNPNGTYNFIGGNAGKENAYYQTDYNNFAPSIGVAYSPNFESGFGKFLFGSEGKTVLRGGYGQSYFNDSIVTSIQNAANSNAGLARTASTLVNLNGRIADGVPSISSPTFITPPRTYLQNNAAGVGNFFGTVFAIDPKLQTPKYEQYSFGIQREFAGGMALEVRYVGTRSNNLPRGIDLNQIDIKANGFLDDFNRALSNYRLTGNPFCATAGCQALTVFQESAGAAGRLGVAPTTASTPAGTLSRTTFLNNIINGTPADLAVNYINSTANLNNQPSSANASASPFVKFLPNPGTGVVDYFLNDGFSGYNSLQVELRRRLSSGLYFQANYTFSKTLTNGVGTTQQLFEPYLDSNNKNLEIQRADFDQTHTFNLNGIYELPFGKGKRFLSNGSLVDKVFGGWVIGGIMQLTSGAPITFVDTRGTFNRTGRSARQTPLTSLTNQQIRALGGIFETNGKIYFVDPSIINPATGRASDGFGSTTFSGQAFFNVNPGQTGNAPRAQLDGPKYFNINTSLLKNIRFTETTRIQLRMEAFNLLNNVNYTFLGVGEQFQNINNAAFGQVTAATAARQLQFALRFEF